MINEFLEERSNPEAGHCWGYHLVIRYKVPIYYMGKWRTETHYFGSCNHNRLVERLDEQRYPEVVEDFMAYTVRNGKRCKQSDWIFTAIHKYGGMTPEIVEIVELPTNDLAEAGEIYDKNMSDAYTKRGYLAYGK